MNDNDRIAVTSRSFSKNTILRNALLERYSHVKFNDNDLSLSNQELVHFLKNTTKVIAGLEIFSDEILSQLSDLKVISRFGVGLDGIDFDALKCHRIKLAVTPGINRLDVAELTLSFMLMLIRRSFFSSLNLKNYQWKKIPGEQLSHKTIGIIGANYVGQEVVRLLRPFECKILIYDIADLSHFCKTSNCKQIDFDTLIQESDIISLHVPATKKTHHMINTDTLLKMKKTAFLINTSRGSIVDQIALKHALVNNEIAGAALDVFEEEPLTDHELISLPHLIPMPHIAGNTVESELAMGYAAIAGLENAEIPADLKVSRPT